MNNTIKLLGVTAIAFSSFSVLAQDSDNTLPIPPELDNIGKAYQACVSSVMSSTDKAQVKRGRLDDECYSQREAFIGVFPTDAQAFVKTNMQRELDVILNALEDAESIVGESIDDASDILDMEEE